MRRMRSFYQSSVNRTRGGMERVGKWLSLQHVTALILIYFAVTLAARPSPILTAALETLGLNFTSNDPSLVFAFFAGILFLKPVSILTYRIATLPLAIYGCIAGWYALTYNSGWATAGFGVGLWLVLQFAATRPEDAL